MCYVTLIEWSLSKNTAVNSVTSAVEWITFHILVSVNSKLWMNMVNMNIYEHNMNIYDYIK